MGIQIGREDRCGLGGGKKGVLSQQSLAEQFENVFSLTLFWLIAFQSTPTARKSWPKALIIASLNCCCQ